jgi:hypothetical protein
MISVFMINPIKKNSSPVEKKAEIIVTMEWDKDSSNDFDLWIKNPIGVIISWLNTSAGFGNLEKDDLGVLNDRQFIRGIPLTIKLNREVIAFRKVIPGEYTVNIHAYKKIDLGISVVDIEVVVLNPYKVFIKEKIEILANGAEYTVVKFTVDETGSIVNTNKLQERFVYTELQ